MSNALRSNIVLTGPAGVGKSSVGQRIATLTGRELLDIGAEIAAAHGKVHELPEAQRLEIERKLVADAAPKRNLVIATTPATLLDQDNIVALLGAEVFHLSASTDTLVERVTADGIAMRPQLAEADDLADEIERLAGERSEDYERFTTVDTSGMSLEQTIDALRKAGAPIEDPTAFAATQATSAGGMDATTRIYAFVIAAALAVLVVLFVLILSF